MRPVFGSCLGWLVKPDQPIVFILDEHQDRDQLVRQCLDIGYEKFVGELDMGMQSWTASSRPTHTIEFIDGSVLVGQQNDQEVGNIIDVRQVNEYKIGHVPRALNVELGSISQASLPQGPLTMMCGHGERAMTSASILARMGRTDLVVFDGGPETWSLATQIPLETN
jgi:hydroxyacylglutathione hydrolase